jgi:hypothetical protein
MDIIVDDYEYQNLGEGLKSAATGLANFVGQYCDALN